MAWRSCRPGRTFLFSDIEGSTRLLEALGRDYNGLLERHHRILRDAFAAMVGVEVRTEGDSFFAVFASATDGVVPAVAIQRAIGAEDWPQHSTLRVRIGLHAGDGRVAALCSRSMGWTYEHMSEPAA
jgi:class 3 adenylate cyclase